MTLGLVAGVGYGLAVRLATPAVFSSQNGILSTPLPDSWAVQAAGQSPGWRSGPRHAAGGDQNTNPGARHRPLPATKSSAEDSPTIATTAPSPVRYARAREP